MKPSGPGWTEDRTELLKKLWAEGLSASVIATRLGEISRCGVLGKVNRLNLPPRKVEGRTPRARSKTNLPLRPTRAGYGARSAVALKPGFSNLRFGSPTVSRAAQSTKEAARLILFDGPTQPSVNLLDLREHHCRFPNQGSGNCTGFCGLPKIDGYSYCAAHCARVFADWRPVRRRA